MEKHDTTATVPARPGERQTRIEKRRYGTVVLETEYESIEGIETPEPKRAIFYDDDRIVEVVGRNAGAMGRILAMAMARNPIRD